MLETSARLLRLLSLLQARRDWTGPELAARLGVSPRTLRRDVDKLRGLGYPVDATPGTAGGYRLGAGAMLPPLLLDDEEAVAVAIGLRTAAGGTITGIEDASVRALVKLEQVLPARLRHRVSALHSVTVPLPVAGPPVDPAVLTVIATAARDRLRISFRYTSHEASRAAAPPNRTTWSTPAAAGTCSPGTWPGATGAPSAPTGSPHPRSPGHDSPRATHPAATLPPTCRSRCQPRRTATRPASGYTSQPAQPPNGSHPPSATSKPTANTPASSIPAPNHPTCSPSTWPSSVPSSRSSTHPNSPSTFSPWPAGSPARHAIDSPESPHEPTGTVTTTA